MPSTFDADAAIRHLSQADPLLGDVIARVGPCRFEGRAEGSHFGALARAIVYQQLSGKAAGTIHGRFLDWFGGEPTPRQVLDAPEEALRGVGLSRQKLAYMRDLAAHVEDGRLPLDHLATLEDDALIQALVAVKGVGRWTAQMFLMFRLGRPDVLPELDLGVQKAVMLAYRLEAMPKPKELTALGERWRPYRSIAAWYWWRSLEIEPLD
jgi:DNA-3-methyladenine glycosylase II